MLHLNLIIHIYICGMRTICLQRSSSVKCFLDRKLSCQGGLFPLEGCLLGRSWLLTEGGGGGGGGVGGGGVVEGGVTAQINSHFAPTSLGTAGSEWQRWMDL